MDQKLIFGNNCAEQARQLFNDNNWNNVLLVTGKKSFDSSGSGKFIAQLLADRDVDLLRFCEFSNNPNIADLRKGLEVIRTFNPSVIIAIGGGSVMDMGKLLRFFLTHDGDLLNGKYKAESKHVPSIAIPTTAGTGAEATHFAVLYDENGKKHSIADKDILPDYAVVYPELTYGQSQYLTACSGFDALAQAIESYWNINATSESDRYAEKAIELIYDILPKLIDHPTNQLRDKMSEGAYWAGRAINITKTTAPHAFSYPFTSVYGISHGHAVSIVFPSIAEYNMKHSSIPDYKINYLKKTLGIKDNTFSVFKNYISNIGLNVPNKNYDVDTIISGISIERLSNNPAEISKTIATGLILNSIYNYE